MLAKVITLSRTAGSKGFRPVMRYVMRADEDAEKLAEGEALEAGHVNFGTEDDDASDSTWFDPRTDDLSDPGMRAAYAEDLAHLCERAEARCRSRPASRFRGNAVYHVAINWREGEHPTRAQAERACLHVMQALGYSEHQAAWAVHRDTDNDHIHLVINKVHPVMATVRSTPRGDYFILDKCMRELELEFGHGRANGPYVTMDTEQGPQIVRMSRAERRERGLLKDAAPHISARAARAEHNAGGTESFQSWATGAPAAALRVAVDKPGATWRDAHEALAKYGVRSERKGSGLILTTTVPGPTGAPRVLAAKASQLGRWASKSALERRLGEFTPPAVDLPAADPARTYQAAMSAARVDLNNEAPPRDDDTERPAGGAHEQHHQRQSHDSQSHQQQDHSRADHQRGARDQEERARRRAERQAERDALAQRFAAGEAERSAAAKKRREELRARHAAERANLRERLRTERAAARTEMRSQGIDRRTADSLFAFKAAAAREQMAKRQRDERQALGTELSRGMVWHVWLEQQAERGDEAAQAALRGIRYREQRRRKAEGNGIEGEPVDPLEALHEVLHKGPDDLVLATLSAERDRLGRHITYRRTATGATAFIDRGPRIDVLSREDRDLEAALRIAAQKYGGQVLLTGSAEFQERAARMATRLGIRVVNSDLAGIVRAEREAQQPYDHRALAAAGQQVREEREREHHETIAREKRATERRQRPAAQERRTPEPPRGEAGSATPQPSDPPVVQRTDPDHRTLAAWWNRRAQTERAAWMAEAAAAGRERSATGAWHRWRDYQDAGRKPPAEVLAARERGERRDAHRGRDEGR